MCSLLCYLPDATPHTPVFIFLLSVHITQHISFLCFGTMDQMFWNENSNVSLLRSGK